MVRWLPSLLLFGSAAVFAAPASNWEDMDSLLTEKGLMTRLGEQVTEKGLMTRLGEQVQQAGATATDQASNLVINALAFLGVPYRWGGNSHETGFDCSGFVRAVYEQSVGKLLPRRSDEQAAATQPIERNDLKPGDLVFFNTMRRAFSHVGIYVGDGKFVHSPRAGAEVRVEDMRVAYWSKRFNGARRVPLAQAQP